MKSTVMVVAALARVLRDEYSLTVGPDLLQDSYLIEELAHFVCGRVPGSAGVMLTGPAIAHAVRGD